jgi:hypothetical protein
MPVWYVVTAPPASKEPPVPALPLLPLLVVVLVLLLLDPPAPDEATELEQPAMRTRENERARVP